MAKQTLLVLFSLSAAAQTGLTVAGFGYRVPSNSVAAAPGQVMTVSVFGIARRASTPILPVPLNGLPTEVEGLTVSFVQGSASTALPIRAVQQSACPATGACSPATTFTIQIPYELNVTAAAALEMRDTGNVVARVAISPVTDDIHIINTCDQTGIYLSVAYAVPDGLCAPMVMHAKGPLVSATAPAKPGETLILWAYGLGAIDHPIPSNCCQSPDELPLATQPFNIGFSYPDASRIAFRRLESSAPTYTGMPGAGLYQVHFVVPNLPPGIPACTESKGNLKALLSGPTSADSADLCVQP